MAVEHHYDDDDDYNDAGTHNCLTTEKKAIFRIQTAKHIPKETLLFFATFVCV